MRTAEQVEALLDKMEELLKNYDESVDEFEQGEFKKRNGEKLGPFEHVMKKLNGDDFDIYKESYIEHRDNFSDMDENEYIDKLVDVLTEKVDALKEALADGDTAEAAHIAEEAQEDIEQVAEKVDEEAHDEVNDEIKEETEEEETEKEENAESEAETEEEDEEKAETAEAIEAELEKELANDKFRKAFL